MKMDNSPDKSEKKLYSGILAEPMPEWNALTFSTEQEFGAQMEAKFTALFAHYEIDATGTFESGPKVASAWANLAWHLARQHVPGFSGPPQRRGRPAIRKSDDVTLVMHVELLKRRDGFTERRAIREIASQNLVSGNEETLRQRYKRAKKSFLPMSRGFDNFAARIGPQALVMVLEGSLSGDDKDIFLSP